LTNDKKFRIFAVENTYRRIFLAIKSRGLKAIPDKKIGDWGEELDVWQREN